MKNCPYCDEEIQDKAIKCKHCGEWLNKQDSQAVSAPAVAAVAEAEQDNAGQKLVLGNDFLLKLYETYSEKISKRIELFGEADGLHASVEAMDAKTLRSEYESSVKKCFDYLIRSSRNALGDGGVNYVHEREKKFLSEDSSDFFRILTELDSAADDVIQNVSGSGTERMLKGLGAGAAAGSILPGAGSLFGAVVGMASGWVAGDKVDKNEKRIVDKWNGLYSRAIEAYGTLWEKLCTLLDEVAEQYPIAFDIDGDAVAKQIEERANPEDPVRDIILRELEKAVDHEDGTRVFFFGEEIPPGKRAGAKNSYVNLRENERIVCLYDSTVFGGAAEGICLTNRAVYWKALAEDGFRVAYEDIKSIQVKKSDDLMFLYINGRKVEHCPAYEAVRKTLEKIRKQISGPAQA